jgi:hypothetical protein
MENTSSTFGDLGKKAIAWIVLIAAVIIALKIIVGSVIGFLTMIFGLVVIVGLLIAVVWALRHL